MWERYKNKWDRSITILMLMFDIDRIKFIWEVLSIKFVFVFI